MIELRPFASLGHANHGWLDANHHFSFANYYDPQRTHWGDLRVWNDDTIAAGTGFGKHPHKNMEIITYVREGAITHEDSLGNKGRTEAGDVQVMSAGTGVFHSEHNLEDTTTRLFQIWILPNRNGHAPSWGTRSFPKGERSNQFTILASGFEQDTDALRIHADARVIGATIRKGETIEYPLGEQRLGYLVPATGSVEIEGTHVQTRDGAAISQTKILKVRALEDAEVVLVDTAYNV
ncbi:pirin [Neokomagataea thailandica NBRC 106555]|uniref:Pirin family protein n=2 Tax=Neokomagataea TaxID=1223423 RepID=A0A4Y6V5H2_9PROT|nr:MULTISPECIES: pirin family protein [Neokomagataea]QDH25309.1 pirin family protein [Neokomagataea tanensis]GBR52487.1 pirin [Neokomagataea thailandica NBRC 106555]